MSLWAAHDALVRAGFNPLQASGLVLTLADLVRGDAELDELAPRLASSGFAATQVEAVIGALAASRRPRC